MRRARGREEGDRWLEMRGERERERKDRKNERRKKERGKALVRQVVYSLPGPFADAPWCACPGIVCIKVVIVFMGKI